VRSVVLDDGTALVTVGVVQPGSAIAVATIDFLANGGAMPGHPPAEPSRITRLP